MRMQNKNDILDLLSVASNKASYLRAICLEQGNNADAAKFKKRRNRLRVEIDELLEEVYQDWIGDANELKTNIDNANNDLKKSIDDIEQKINTAQNIVKAISYLDKMIEIASKVL